MTSAPVPATPAAQPYGAYRPTVHEDRIAALVDYYNRPMVMSGQNHTDVAVLPAVRPRVH